VARCLDFAKKKAFDNECNFVEGLGLVPEERNVFNRGFFLEGSSTVLIPKAIEGEPDALVRNPPVDYILKFTVKLMGKCNAITGKFCRIIKFTAADLHGKEYKHRNPEVGFTEGTKLYVETLDQRHEESIRILRSQGVHTIEPALEIGKKYVVIIRVVGSTSSVSVNGSVLSSIFVDVRNPLKDVKAYIGLHADHVQMKAYVSDISFTQETVDYTPTFMSDYFYGGSRQITKSVEGKPDAIVFKPPTNYSLRFTIEPKGKAGKGGNYGSILHVTTGGDCCKYGQRVPGIWFYPSSTKLYVSTGDDSNGNNIYQLPYELDLYKKYAVEVHVYGTKSTVYVNGELVAQNTIGTHKQLDQVEVYIGDPWSEAANAIISDISFTKAVDNTPTFMSDYFYGGSRKITKSEKGKPDAIVFKPPMNYSLRFTITPQGTVNGLGSILHFTTGGDCCNYGQRVPGIWFYPSSTKLYVSTGDDSNGNKGYELPYGLDLYKKYAVEVHVFGSKSSVYVNGVLAAQKTIGTRAPLDQVKVYIGDPWYEAANAIISDISFTAAVDNTIVYNTYIKVQGKKSRCSEYGLPDVSKEHCTAAGLSVGGRLRNGAVATGSWHWVSYGCSIQSGGDICYNTNEKVDEDKCSKKFPRWEKSFCDGFYSPVCVNNIHKMQGNKNRCFEYGMTDVSKEDCKAVGLLVGGRLRNGAVVTGSWNFVSYGCSIQSGGDIHYNTNGEGVNSGGFSPVCVKNLKNL